jgi:hypothetical protein
MGAALVWGCGQEEPERKYRSLQGEAISINPATGEVAMKWYNPKRQEYLELHGWATEETEVLINGRAAALAEAHPGDHVEVIGYQEGTGANRRLVATKVLVTRQEAFATTAAVGEPTTSTQPSQE